MPMSIKAQLIAIEIASPCHMFYTDLTVATETTYPLIIVRKATNYTMMSRRGTRSPGTPNPEDGPLKTSRRSRSTLWSRQSSKIVGAILLGVAALWLGLLIFHRGAPAGISILQIPGLVPINTPIGQPSPLVAAGITLGRPSQAPALNQQQALLIASQLEPDAATNAKKTSSEYVLLNYTSTSASTSHTSLRNVPVWMVFYQQIPLAPANPSVDPTPSSNTSHDLYVFLDANSGKELLAIWA